VRGLLAVSALAAALSLLVAGALWTERARARHLAVPVLEDPSLPPQAPPIEPEARAGCTAVEVARAPSRVTALLPASDGALWVGTFDAGLLRGAPGEEPLGVALDGAERFVNALAEHDGLVWAATQRGLLAFDEGRRVAAVLEDGGVTSLARAGGALWAGTARGVFRAGVEGAEPARAVGPSGEPLRVNALAAGRADLWIGTPAGAYSIPLATLAAPLLTRAARWHPLVFGSPPAETNVVTALAALGEGAVAGTDDGGLVLLRRVGEASAARLADPRANEVNPGAAAAAPSGALLGTQGGGLLAVSLHGDALAVARPAGLEAEAISAVWASGDAVLAGTADGRVLRVECPEPLAAR
jgi:hypothetical protein